MTVRISAEPDPVAQGGSLKVCYDFPDELDEASILLDYHGAEDVSVYLTRGEPCQTVTVPDTATSLICVDESGGSEDVAVGIEAG